MRTSITARVLLVLLVSGATACAVPERLRGGGVAGSSTRLTIPQTLRLAYDAGFRTEAQLTAVVSIGIAESSLIVKARKWHPEHGFRRATDVIGVHGPASVWNATRTQQLHSDRGIWQISSRFWPMYRDTRVDDPARAAVVVWEISNHGRNFMHWDTYKAQVAQKHYDAAVAGWPAVRPLVQKFLASEWCARAKVR
jgi:Lysozyme like domain